MAHILVMDSKCMVHIRAKQTFILVSQAQRRSTCPGQYQNQCGFLPCVNQHSKCSFLRHTKLIPYPGCCHHSWVPLTNTCSPPGWPGTAGTGTSPPAGCPASPPRTQTQCPCPPPLATPCWARSRTCRRCSPRSCIRCTAQSWLSGPSHFLFLSRIHQAIYTRGQKSSYTGNPK